MNRILPILFNTEMVRATLKKTNPKTVTRRAIKGFIPDDAKWGYTMFTPQGYISCRGTFADEYGEKFFKPPYQKGDILYVRETWCRGSLGYQEEQYFYKADDNNKFPCKWRPSIHMPKEAARIWLKVTDVRVERLQDITSNQILKEGANPDTICHYIKQMPGETTEWIEAAHKIEYQQIWNSTLKKSDLDRYGWDANPWVWVIEFERCKRMEEKQKC